MLVRGALTPNHNVACLKKHWGGINSRPYEFAFCSGRIHATLNGFDELYNHLTHRARVILKSI
jgi:hypothetical protein